MRRVLAEDFVVSPTGDLLTNSPSDENCNYL